MNLKDLSELVQVRNHLNFLINTTKNEKSLSKRVGEMDKIFVEAVRTLDLTKIGVETKYELRAKRVDLSPKVDQKDKPVPSINVNAPDMVAVPSVVSGALIVDFAPKEEPKPEPKPEPKSNEDPDLAKRIAEEKAKLAGKKKGSFKRSDPDAT